MEYERVCNLCQVLSMALRFVSMDDLPNIKHTLTHYHRCMYQLLLMYFGGYEREQRLEKLCAEAGSVLQVESRDPEILMALSDLRMRALEMKRKELADQVAGGLMSDLHNLHGMHGAQGASLMNKPLTDFIDMESVARSELCQVKAIHEALCFMIGQKAAGGAGSPRRKTEKEKLLTSIWSLFYDGVLALLEPKQQGRSNFGL